MALHQIRAPHYVEQSFAEKLGATFDTEIPTKLVRVLSNDVWITHEIGDWIVGCLLVMQGTQPVIGEVRIVPKDPSSWSSPGIASGAEQFGNKFPLTWNGELFGLAARGVPEGGMTRTLLRDIPTRWVQKEVGRFLREARTVPQFRGLFQYGADELMAAVDTPKRRRGKSDLFYARLARDYTERVNSGSRHPIDDLANRRGIAPKSRMRDMIREARERGLLGNKKHGMAGGQLTDRARALLEPAGKKPMPEQSERKSRKVRHGSFNQRKDKRVR